MKKRLPNSSIVVSLLILAFFLIILALTVYGVFLAFSASIILGIIVLIVEPLPLLISIVSLSGKPDLCQEIAKWLHLPF